jgi:uncharacterized protein (DUF2384 family)
MARNARNQEGESVTRTRNYVLASQTLKDLDYISRRIELPETKLGLVFRVNPKTISRWKSNEVKQIKPEHTLSVRRFKDIIDLGLKVFNRHGLLEFLLNPQPVFNNRSGFDMLIIGEYDRVESALAALYEGAGL